MSLDSIFILLLISGIVLLLFRSKSSDFFAPDFEQRPIMNKPEIFIFDTLRREFPSRWHVMTQVSYGAFLRNRSRNKFMSINSKRADFVVLYPSLQVAAVFEYQGSGHFGTTEQDARRATRSDDIKRQACSEAGVHFVELPPYIEVEELRAVVKNIINPTDQTGPDASGGKERRA